MDLPLNIFDLLGLIGAGLFVVSFAGTQIEKLDPHDWPSLTMNLVGAILVLISLVHAFNLASFVLEVVWGLVAFYGLVKFLVRRNRRSPVGTGAGRGSQRPGSVESD